MRWNLPWSTRSTRVRANPTAPVGARRGPTVWCLLIATGAAMGLAVPLSKQAVALGVGPLSFALWPALAAALVLALLAGWRHGPPVNRARLAGFGLVTGLLGAAVPNVLVAWVSGQAGAGVTAIAYTLPPAFTLGLALLFGMESARWQRALAVALAVAGGLWLALARVAGGHLAVAGAVALLAIPLSLALGNIYRARFLPAGVPAEWLGAAMSAGAALLLAPAWLFAPAAASQLSLAGAPYLLAQVGASVVAAILYFTLQRRADAVTMSFIGYVIALTAALLGALVLDETLPWQIAPAAGLVALGFALIQRYPAVAAR